MSVKAKLTSLAMVLAASIACGQAQFNMGAMDFCTPDTPDTTNYLPDMESLGGNWMMMTQAHFRSEPEMWARFQEAENHGIRIVLTDARLWSDPLDMSVTRIACGQNFAQQSRSLCAAGDHGENAPDGRSHFFAGSDSSGWFQDSVAWDSMRVGGWFNHLPAETTRCDTLLFTAYFSIRAAVSPPDTSGGALDQPVCSLVVSESLPEQQPDPLGAVRVITWRMLPGDTYCTQSVSFKRPNSNTGLYRYRIFKFQGVDTLWSDSVAIYDMYADSLTKKPDSASFAPYIQKVRDIAGHYRTLPALHRYYLADEAPPSQFKSSGAVNSALGIVSDRTGISWSCWDRGDANHFEEYASTVAPSEFWVDAYEFYGRTYPNRDTTTGGQRTPVDVGDRFQVQLDSLCMVLGSARQAAQNHGIPLWVDVQAFGEFLAYPPHFAFHDTWNTIPGPRDSGLRDEGIWREPTEREFKCQSWLALAYGAKGLDYWQLKSNRADLGAKHIYTMGLLKWDTTHSCAQAGPPYRAEFYHVQDFLKNTLQKIAPTLLQLTSTAVRKSGDLPADFISACSDSLLQFGTFTGPKGRYFIVVNRHCLPTDFVTPSVTLNLGPSPAGSYYLLDEVSGEAIAPVSGSGGGSFRYFVHFAPGQGRLLRVVPFAGSVVRNQGQSFSNLMQVALHPGYGDGTDSPVDSMRIYCQHSQPQDTVETDWTPDDSTNWIGYRADCVSRARLEGWSRFGVRYRLHDGTGTPPYWSAPITIDTSAPHDSMNINHNAWITNSVLCTLCSYVSDGNSAPGKMQFTNDTLHKLELIADPKFVNPSYWAKKNCSLLESLGVARLDIVGNSQSYLYHRIPAESIGQYQGWQMVLSADCVSDSLPSGVTFALDFLYVPTNPQLAHDTVMLNQPVIPADSGTGARVSTYNYSVQFPFLIPPPAPNHRLWAVDVGVWRNPTQYSGGRLWIGSLRLDALPHENWPQNQAGWQTYDTLHYPWHLSGEPYSMVKARYQDRAGNEGVWVKDGIALDPIPPLAVIGFPGNGRVLTESLVSVLGLAFDPPAPWDTTSAKHQRSHFKRYKLTWSPAAYSGQDSAKGILPESLFSAPQYPPPPESAGLVNPWRHLAWWNTRSIINQSGAGFFRLTLTAEDSADNKGIAQVVVRLDTTVTRGSGCGAGSGAMSMTTTSSGDLLVGTTTGLITQYTPDLDSVQSMTVQDSTGPAVISGMATDSFGAIYVGDTRDKNVKVCDEQGNPTDTIGNRTQLTSPNSVAIARNGDVWVADRSRNVVRVYDVSNNLKLSFGSTGSDTGQFLGAYALALGYLSMMDLETSLDSSGNPVTDTTITVQIRCLVADKGNHRVQVFDTAGHYLTSFGDSILSQPVALSVDTSGCCFVADQDNKAIYGFNPNGTLFLTMVGADTITPVATTIGTDNGNLYALDQNTHQLLEYLVCYTDTAEMGGGQSGAINPVKLPRELTLEQSWPNPATRTLTTRYGIPKMTNVSLKVYDISGKLVRTLQASDKLKPGYHNINWDCKDNRSREIAGGVYFYRLVTGGSQETLGTKPAARVKTRKLVIAR